MIPARVIARKRDGETLPPEELRHLLEGYLAGDVTDAQMAAFLMAVTLRGLAPSELEVLVSVMMSSGAVMRRTETGRPRIDKHSTGGVGDKVSLILAPLAAALGLDVPMMSGRGLGHTGGTLDKLESIPGFSTSLDLVAFEAAVSNVGTAMIGQTDEIAPLDRRLYALRSATGTVPCIPLIASSIMSKKLSEDLDGLVLDVKVGAGSFLTRPTETQRLAETMVEIGHAHGVPTVALLTRMDWPIGRAIGNALEVAESIECLRGGGPSDLVELTCTLVGEMLVLAGVEDEPHAGTQRAADCLASGRALPSFEAMVSQQGGDGSIVRDPAVLPHAPVQRAVTASVGGVVTGIDPVGLGWGVVELGGGRRSTDDTIDPAVGFELAATVGEQVSSGQRLGMVHAADSEGADRGEQVLEAAFTIRPAGELLPSELERLDTPVIVGRER